MYISLKLIYLVNFHCSYIFNSSKECAKIQGSDSCSHQIYTMLYTAMEDTFEHTSDWLVDVNKKFILTQFKSLCENFVNCV